jgi:hypothetical protein
MPKSRIVWKAGKSGGSWAARIAPHESDGGTCRLGNEVLIYDDLHGSISLTDGLLWHQRYEGGYQNFCSLQDVEAVFNEQGQQIYPEAGGQ